MPPWTQQTKTNQQRRKRNSKRNHQNTTTTTTTLATTTTTMPANITTTTSDMTTTTIAPMTTTTLMPQTTTTTAATTTTTGRGQPSNTVSVNDAMFATLDDAWSNAPLDQYCSKNFFAQVPEGWVVAEDTPNARIAIELNSFGSQNIVLSNATYIHNLDKLAGTAKNTTNGVTSDAACPSRILIQRVAKVEPPVAPFTPATSITNFITFQGKDYAMLDNSVATANMNGDCMHGFFEIPSGWEVAADAEETKAVVITAKYPFRYMCKVVSTGRSYEQTLSPTNAACGFSDMLALAESKTLNAKLAGVSNHRCGGVLISRASTALNTWTVETSISNTFTTLEGHVYATLDNSKASDVYMAGMDGSSSFCQNVAMKIPDKWLVANSTMPGESHAAAQPWGTFCIGGLDFNGKPCNYSVLKSDKYASAQFCDQKVLIKREAEDCVSTWSDWSACPTTCTTEKVNQTRTRGAITTPPQFGGACNLNETRLCSQTGCIPGSPASRSAPTLLVALVAAAAAALF
eukprot:comp23542_c2_seq2/m.39712 comp23542_c2_seq2/g.39712  ORF comp23542_c2_seq2/g.39712 comp23542_c2_seq2/m.39712 type:complete len:517 (-) comp23542_c2_seq2:249-1799(-)